jgi:competence protein CoiA
MKFAIVDSNKLVAAKGVKGICPRCGSELIAKCGNFKINHWAHKGIRNCDPWWENETEWHRSWKNNFSTEWQENILTDELTGEKHIADIRTINGLVIEFQHSHIDQDERTKRENFYKNMVWVVDGTRLKRDYPRFLKGKEDLRNINKQGLFLVHFPDECFPSAWIGSSVPVIFDFKGTETINDDKEIRNHLYLLFPSMKVGETKLAVISRESFINNTISGEWFKKHQEPQNQFANPPIMKNINLNRRESQYIYERGQFIKRRRF